MPVIGASESESAADPGPGTVTAAGPASLSRNSTAPHGPPVRCGAVRRCVPGADVRCLAAAVTAAVTAPCCHGAVPCRAVGQRRSAGCSLPLPGFPTLSSPTGFLPCRVTVGCVVGSAHTLTFHTFCQKSSVISEPGCDWRFDISTDAIYDSRMTGGRRNQYFIMGNLAAQNINSDLRVQVELGSPKELKVGYAAKSSRTFYISHF